MPRQRSKKLTESRKATQQPASSAQDNLEQENSDNESFDAMDKDEDEEELDRLVLGDGAEFKTQIAEDASGMDEDESEAELETGGVIELEASLEDVDDAEVGQSVRNILVKKLIVYCSCSFSMMERNLSNQMP